MSGSSQTVPAGANGTAGTPTASQQNANIANSNTSGGNAQSSSNLNQIVLEYLNKKGYKRSESTLRQEAAQHATQGPNSDRAEHRGAVAYFSGYFTLKQYVDEAIEVYKPEIQKLQWPMFVYSFLELAKLGETDMATKFFDTYSTNFGEAYKGDIQRLQYLKNAELVSNSPLARIYLNNKYRVSITQTAFNSLIMFLEKKDREGGTVVIEVIQTKMQVKTIDRDSAGATHSVVAMLTKGGVEQDLLDEDEGIPGHNPGSANTDPNAPAVLTKVNLGSLPMEADQEEDVKGDLEDADAADPPEPGQNSLMDEFKKIKEEEDMEAPNRDAVPLPKPLARDVEMEVAKIKSHRDRFVIPPKSSGIAAGISIVMYTFHNTQDTVNCIDFSGDETMVAAGTSDSYIRVWSLDGKPLKYASVDGKTEEKPPSSRRLIGHSGPVYAVSFSPSMPQHGLNPENNGVVPDTSSRYLLSASLDKTIRLWYVGSWNCLAVFKGHIGPVWDLRWSPQGHYFASAGSDKTARLWRTDMPGSLRIFAGHDSDVEKVAFHPNGAYVFTAGYDRTVRMWDTNRGTAVRIFTGHTSPVTAIECATNGKTLASADEAGNIILWDLTTGQRLKRMRGHGRGGIWSMSWSAESTLLVSGGADNTVRTWDPMQTTDGPSGSKAGLEVSGGKTDGNAIGAGIASMAGGKKGKAKEVSITADQVSAFPTKKTPVYKVRFTNMNLVMAGGAYLP